MLIALNAGEKDLFLWREMAKLVITGDGSSKSVDVSDASEAVRTVASSLKAVATDSSILSSMQKWADDGFKRPLRLKVQGKAMVVEYRN